MAGGDFSLVRNGGGNVMKDDEDRYLSLFRYLLKNDVKNSKENVMLKIIIYEMVMKAVGSDSDRSV